MTEPASQKPFVVLAAIDMSPSSERVFLRALDLANAHGPAEVHLLCVVAIPDSPFSLSPTAGSVPPDAVEGLRSYAAQKMTHYDDIHPNHTISRVQTHVLVGAPADEIVWLAAHLAADMVVVGTHGRRGVRRMLLGSVAEKVARHTGCPVVIEREKQHNQAWVVPQIEPVCPECAEKRRQTNGEELWCERHSEHHARYSIHPAIGGGSSDPSPRWG
jgi:nucleotide-binding universal stress UspA family protein